MFRPATRAVLPMALALVVARQGFAQKPARDTSVATGITAGESDAERPRRALSKRLEFNLGFTTIYFGGGLLVDYAGYDPASASREQFTLVSQGKLRDARVLTGGRFKLKRPVT